jgi:hypothetical protein
MSEDDWTYERINNMIENGVEESLHLDYKAAGSLAKKPQKRDEIVKDVTAFANSDGGVIIYGVQEYSGAEQKHLPEKVTPIARADFSKEWLEQVISNAAPRIPSVRVYPVPIPDKENQCLYVVEIPQGETAHQSADCKYYRRYNFESVAMRDHEIRDVMNRATTPKIEVEAHLNLQDFKSRGRLSLKLKNVGNTMALHFQAAVRLPLELDGTSVTPTMDSPVMPIDDGGHYYELSLGQGNGRTPLFPQATVRVFQELRTDVMRHELTDGATPIIRPTISITVYADEMKPLHFEVDPSSIRNEWRKIKPV